MNQCLTNMTGPVLPLRPASLPGIEAWHRYVHEKLIGLKLFFPCKLKLLIVTDASGSFDEVASFGLGHFLKVFSNDPLNAAQDNPALYVNFDVKTAHRGGSSADFQNFKFDAHDLSMYDQIWLFGVSRSSDSITDAELKALSRFMNEGGGVFATGDHEDLGVGMCGRVPRVRCMRRWYYETADPLGSPQAPPQFGGAGMPRNHYTISDNPDVPGTSLSQSDNFPQRIFPRYRHTLSGTFLQRRYYPHPLLCGPFGIIKVLPDHMHEGQCDIYEDFGRTLNFDGYSFTEFPVSAGGSSPHIPEVIAENINQLDSTRFASISVYDGHETETNGRIVCDATWHHFFNVNLDGFEESRQRVRDGIGTADDLRSEQDYKNIRAYFRNIAYWISRRNDQTCMRRRGWHIVTHHFDFKITYKPLEKVRDHVEYFMVWGTIARDALNQLAPQCQWYRWIIDLVKHRQIMKRLIPFPEEKLRGLPEPFKWMNEEQVLWMLVGRAVYNLYEFNYTQKEISPKLYEQFDEVMQKGQDQLLKQAMKEMTNEMTIIMKEFEK